MGRIRNVLPLYQQNNEQLTTILNEINICP